MLRLNTLGRLNVQGPNGQPLPGAAAQPRRLALLAVLAAAGERAVTRDKIVGLLWPDADEDRARRGLSQALYALRQDLGAEEVFLGLKDLRLNPEIIGSDVAEFQAAMAEGNLSKAVACYGGPFLDGFHLSAAAEFERWADEERTRVGQQYAEALQRLARDAESRSDHQAAVGWWRKLAGQDPLNARFAIGLMKALAASGDRNAALQHGRVYEILIQEELDAPPDRDVVEYAQHLRREQVASPAAPVASSHAAATHLRVLPEANQPSTATSSSGLPAKRPPGNLPVELTSFVGRERELAEVRRLLTTNRLVTLTGPGGCGKTRLALAVAAESSGEFREGAWWVELAPLSDPALLPQEVVSALGTREAAGRPPLETLTTDLKDKSLLLVLDNCEHLVAACAALSNTLLHACPGLRILATSREALGIAGERAWPVPSLSVPRARHPATSNDLAQFESVRLFTERAVAASAGFELTEQNGPAVARICQRVDGIPLAIELAAARVRILSAQQIADRLDDCFGLLTAGMRTAIPRHRTLQATMDWSYQLLSEQERRFFSRLSVFAGGFRLEAVKAVGVGEGVGESDVVDLLAHLVDKSLVVVEEERDRGTRYRLLEPIRQYARETLRQSGEDNQIRDLHAEYFIAFADHGAPKPGVTPQASWFRRLAQEHDNVRAAMSWMLEREDPEAAAMLGWVLWRFWWVRGHFSEGRRWMEAVLAMGSALPMSLRAKVLFVAGTMADGQADYAAATAFLDDSLASFKRLGDKYGAACALGSGGLASIGLQEYPKGIAQFEAAAASFLDVGERWGAAFMLTFSAMVWLRQGDPPRAKPLAEEGVRLFREVGESQGASVALWTLAGVAEKEGDHQQARRLFEEGLALAAAFQDETSMVYCLEGLGGVAAAESRVEQAARLWGAAEGLLNSIDPTPYPYAPDRSLHQGRIDALRAQVGDEAFRAEWATGRSMTLSEAVGCALGHEASNQALANDGSDLPVRRGPERLLKAPKRPTLEPSASSASSGKRGAPMVRRLVILATALVLLVGAGTLLLLRHARGQLVAGQTLRLAFESVLELDPAVSPDGRMVAYAAERNGRTQILVRQIDGGQPVAVARGLPGAQRWPRWSPDGSRIAFQSGLGGIYQVPAFGGAPRLLVQPSRGDWVASPAWSPDGREMAYVEDFDIYVRPTGGGEPRRIADVENAHSLTWSPDGQWIAYVDGNSTFTFGAEPTGAVLTNIGNVAPSSIWIVPAAGGTPVRITEGRSLDASPIWLPDARGLLFISSRSGRRDIYQVSVTASGKPAGSPARLTMGLDAQAIGLSADGRRLVYSVLHLTANIWAVRALRGKSASMAQAKPVTSGNEVIEGLALSPDGAWLAFDSDRNGNQEIYKMPVTGGDPVQLTSYSGDDFMSSWSPNGRELAYYSFVEGARRLRVMSADGGVPTDVVATPRNQRFPGWSPDGMALVFSSNATGESEIYVVARNTDSTWRAARRLTLEGGINARWSPDGQSIAYSRYDGLWLVSPRGGAPRHLLRLDEAAQTTPPLLQWSKDGREIYYKAFDLKGESSIWSLPAAGGLPRVVVRLDDPSRPSSRPEFATDGERFFFTVGTRESDIWTMDLVQSR